MAVQKTIDNLKERPKDERKAVATGIAAAVVLILFIGWAFLFFKKIQRNGAEFQQIGTSAQEEFNFDSVRDAQEAILRDYQDASGELRQARDSAISSQVDQGAQLEVGGGEAIDRFGFPTE